MAWAQQHPSIVQSAVVQGAAQLERLAAAITEREAAERHGLFTETERAELGHLRVEYQSLLTELQQLRQVWGG